MFRLVKPIITACLNKTPDWTKSSDKIGDILKFSLLQKPYASPLQRGFICFENNFFVFSVYCKISRSEKSSVNKEDFDIKSGLTLYRYYFFKFF